MQSTRTVLCTAARFFACLVALAAMDRLGHTASAAPVTLFSASGNSSIVVDPLVQPAISSWIVDGVGQLNELSNWYRVGNAGPERSVHTLPFISAGQTGPDSFSTTYANAQFEISIDFGVTGGAIGSGYSRMGEEVRIRNKTAAPLEFHFFEYVDLDLTNTPSDDVGTPLSPSGLTQTDGITVVNAGFLNYDHHEWALFNSTLTHLSPTTSGTPSTLNDNPAFGNTFGTGDVTWALEWDFVGTTGPRPAIPAFQTAVITKNLECMYVPEPTSALLLAGMGGIAWVRRGRRL